MQIVTYLGFTLLSIFIQFNVIDFIQGRLKIDEKVVDLKGTSQKRQLSDVLKDITYKPHAIYFQTNKGHVKKHHSERLLSNNTLMAFASTTDITTTEFDVLYDENTTATEETFTTESLYTSTEFENITEITLFEKENDTMKKPDIVKKKTVVKACTCNFLYRVCDINCCCDTDCSDSEVTLFPNCFKTINITNGPEDDICYSQLPYLGFANGLFCIVKSNLPDTNNIIHQKIKLASTDNFLTWKSVGKSQTWYEYSNNVYKYGEPIWLLKNDSIYHMDMPSPRITNYCTGRKPMQFLKEEKYVCNVKLQDLEMLRITKNFEGTAVISALPVSMNSSVLNCTNLHCVNWTVIVCDNMDCTNYSKNLHDPTCTESVCTNLALKINYIFHYYNSKIINATLEFHVQNLTMNVPYISQEIEVKFILANKSITQILKLSGSPGYQEGLPIIASYAETNYTDTFYDTTMETKRYLSLPQNQNGVCISSNISENVVTFGINKRIKCRYHHKYLKLGNSTKECKNIQNNIYSLFTLNYNIVLSPLGDPQGLKDKDWLSLDKSVVSKKPLYGEVQNKTSNLICFNLVTRYSLTFSFAHGTRNNNRIFLCNYKTTSKNVTLSLEDMSTVITVDVNFVDVTKPSVIEHAPGPNLNFHLPKDFFYPFLPNKCSILNCNIFVMILYCIQIIACK